MTPVVDNAANRQLVYGLLITLAVGLALGRLSSAERVNEPSVHKANSKDPRPRPAWPTTRPDPWPTFSSNDRSRWACVRALVDEGTFVIGKRDERGDTGIIFEDGWQSVDKVLHPTRHEFYSTKPPLLSVIAAGEYWLMKHLFGWSIVRDRWLVIPLILVTLNIVPFILYLAIVVWLAERFGQSDWSKYFVVGAAGFATLVSPFLITFNNHTIATVSVALALYSVLKLIDADGQRLGWFFLAGLAAGFAACNELPATALAAGLGAYLLWRWPVKTLVWFMPAALVFVAAMLLLNYWELGQWRPAYAEFGGPWYQYEGSHWRIVPGQVKRGIDFAARNGETKPIYALHLLIGHHGWFSLTPILFLGLAGMLGQLRPSPQQDESRFRLLALFSLLVSVVVIAFYIYKSDNYGGWTNGPRWLMWLTPLWLVCMLPILDRLAPSRAGRWLALALLAVSVLSMSYQMWNPWRHPWIYVWMESRGWIAY